MCEASRRLARDEATPSDWRAVERTIKGRQEFGERPAVGALWDGALGDRAGSGSAGRWEGPTLQGMLDRLQSADGTVTHSTRG